MEPSFPFGFIRKEDSPGYMLWQTTMSWQRLIKAMLDEYQISHAQFVIMAMLLWHESGITQAKVAQESKLDKMTVSKSLRKLTDLGYVNRMDDQADSRAKSVSLSLRGEELVRTLVPKVEAIDHQFFGKLKRQKPFIEDLKCLTKEDLCH